MKNALRKLETFDRRPANEPLGPDLQTDRLGKAIDASWAAIAPFWPLRSLVAVNPLQGLEDLPFEEALVEAAAWFQQRELPEPLDAVNRETIKWCQAFFDGGQATIAMPLRHRGLYDAWRALAPLDRRLHGRDADKRKWLAALPADPERAIGAALQALDIPPAHQTRFMMLLLTTLPGWAAHVRYRTDWADSASRHPHPVSGAQYLALRLAITAVVWPGAKALLGWHLRAREAVMKPAGPLPHIEGLESRYRRDLLESLSGRARSPALPPTPPRAQVVFCIDVRAEPFRRALEEAGDYETLGFAGFFGVPIQIEDADTGRASRACPVLLEPSCTVRRKPVGGAGGGGRLKLLRRLYQSLKYTFTAPFALVETLGLANGAWMALLSIAPVQADRLRRRLAGWVQPPVPTTPDIGGIPVADRCAWAENALRTMGLTRDFARLVVLCGHGSTTRNNAYATALDCGACGGRHGGPNAQVLAQILNDPWVREHLIGRGIRIPGTTHFVAAQHDTTTDEVTLLDPAASHAGLASELQALRRDLDRARLCNARRRHAALGGTIDPATAAHGAAAEAGARQVLRRSRDWAEVRPEWGLARNAAFIAAPRALTRGLDLDGRAFLHSYDWRQDPEGEALKQILTAPMVVAQWINAQYLFSTLDNVSFGSGSKVTQNVCGKIGVMQGNASDLMHGLPLQSVFASDSQAWHEPMRLLTVVHAPRDRVLAVARSRPELRKLLGNGWVTLACVDPDDGGAWVLRRDLLSWREAA